jgi:hypothetical protein
MAPDRSAPPSSISRSNEATKGCGWRHEKWALFATVLIGADRTRYHLVAELLPNWVGWDWAVWRAGDLAGEHGNATAAVSAMAQAEWAVAQRKNVAAPALYGTIPSVADRELKGLNVSVPSSSRGRSRLVAAAFILAQKPVRHSDQFRWKKWLGKKGIPRPGQRYQVEDIGPAGGVAHGTSRAWRRISRATAIATRPWCSGTCLYSP